METLLEFTVMPVPVALRLPVMTYDPGDEMVKGREDIGVLNSSATVKYLRADQGPDPSAFNP
jgi:hypothetical protein